MPEQATYNVAIIGKTGVGKSSIINYLYGSKIVEAGVGDPVTKKGFHPVKTNINGLPTIIYDSMGLEGDKYQEWMLSLEDEIRNRGADKPASDWFHSVFYCINAGGSRIEPVDSEVINKLIEGDFKVSVILTKCDQVNEDDEEELKNVIIRKFNNNVSVISTSVGAKNRSGISPAFGKEDIQQKAFEDFFDSLIVRLPLRCESVMKEVKDCWKKEVDGYVENINIAGWNSAEQRDKISARTENMPHLLMSATRKEFNNTVTMFANFSDRLGYPPLNLVSNSNKIKITDKEISEFSWFKLLADFVFPTQSPVFKAAYSIIFGKYNAQDEINRAISQASDEIDKNIEFIKNEITEQLRIAKSIAMGKLK
jgi:predicted GTPase